MAAYGAVRRVRITAAGVRHPIVIILLLISFFTVLSGKPLDGLLLVTVAIALAWDAGKRSRRADTPGRHQCAAHAPDGSQEPDNSRNYRVSDFGPDDGHNGQISGAWPRTARLRRRYFAGAAAATAVIYSLVVGFFTRYSWPATVAIVGLGAAAVAIGWSGPARPRDVPGKFSRTAVFVWGSLLVCGGLWELGALLGQPNFETSSYAHPTISTLTDPLLATSAGRSVALLAWIGLGVFLVKR